MKTNNLNAMPVGNNTTKILYMIRANSFDIIGSTKDKEERRMFNSHQ